MASLHSLSVLFDDLSDHRVVRWVLAHPVVSMKGGLVYLSMLSFVVMLFVYCFSYVFYGLPLANPFLSDVQFHLSRAADLSLALNSEDYYAPLFHFLLSTLSVGRDPALALCFVAPFLIYVIVPACFYFMAKCYHQDAVKAIYSTLLYFFLYNSIFYVISGTYTQALNSAMLCLIVYYSVSLMRREHGALVSLVYFMVLGFFSHTEGGLFGLVVGFVGMLLAGRLVPMLLSVLSSAAVFYKFPFMLSRGASMLNMASSVPSRALSYPLSLLWKIMLFIHPVVAGFGVVAFRLQERKDYLVWFCVLAPLVLLPFDVQLRTILTSMMFLCVPAGETLDRIIRQDLKEGLFWLGACGLMWFVVSLSHVAILLLYFQFRYLLK